MPKVEKVRLSFTLYLKTLTQRDLPVGSHHRRWPSGTSGCALSEAEKWHLKRHLRDPPYTNYSWRCYYCAMQWH
jgi:hypothetical protein